MNENEAIKILRNNFPKTCKMVDGRYKGGFDDTECEFGKALLLSISALEEIQQYHSIGTVEECRKAREKQRAKKPIDEYIHCISKVHQGNCPVCGNHVYADLCNITPMKYCQYCGQALSWERDDE